MDFFHLKGKTYLLIVDYFSKYIEVWQMTSTTACSLIQVLKDTFARFGIPNVVISDQGPPFDSADLRNFFYDWDIKHVHSSPLHPCSNGQAERTIQTVKSMMTKASEEGKDLAVVLLNYRSTPTIGGKSPAELLMGRKLRTFLPTLPSVLQPSFPTATHHTLLHERQKQ